MNSGRGARSLRVQQRDLEHGRDDVVEVLPAKLGIEVLSGNHLALLGDADAGLHGARRLRQDGLVARPAAATDRAAAAMEHAQIDAAALERHRSVATSALYSSQPEVRKPPSLLLSE